MKEINWFWAMKKIQPPLALNLHGLGLKYLEDIGINIDFHYKFINGDIYFRTNASKEIERMIDEKIDENSNHPDEVQAIIEDLAVQIGEKEAELKEINLVNLSIENLLEHYKSMYYLVGKMTGFMSFKYSVQMFDVLLARMNKILVDKGLKGEMLQDALFLFATSKKDSYPLEEQKSLLKVAAGNGNISDHFEKYKWMNVVMHSGFPYEKKHFEERIKQIEDPEAELKRLEERKQLIENKIATKIKELKLDKEELRLLNQLRTWAYMRTYVKDNTSIGLASIVPFLAEMAKQRGVTYDDITFCNYEELCTLPSKEEIKKIADLRRGNWGYLIINNKEVFYDKTNVHEIAEPETTPASGLKGMTCQHGKAKGPAVIVNSLKDLELIKKGCILITHMTTTNFVPYLNKVAGIVTEEGGLTCHAAIISREMNIPCILGTRMATKTFRNGEIVELETKTGRVKRVI